MQVANHFSQGDWFLITVFIIAAIACLFAALRMFHRARLIEDMPTSKIRSCSQGYVELFGTAKWMEGPEIQAPLSGLPCVWYSFSVEEYIPQSKQKWRRINSGVSDQLFLLEDDTGACVVDPDEAEVTPTSSTTWYGNERIGPRTHISPLDILTSALMQSGQKYRYTEKRIDVYESLYAIGDFCSIGTDYRQSIKEAVLEKLRILKRDKEKLATYDKNQDGQIDENEWEQARIDAKQAAVEDQLAKPLPQRMHMLKKPQTKKYQPFLLSTKSESHISRNNRIFSAGLASLFVLFITSIFLKITGVF